MSTMSNISSSSNMSHLSNMSSLSNNSTNLLACPTASESDRQLLHLLRQNSKLYTKIQLVPFFYDHKTCARGGQQTFLCSFLLEGVLQIFLSFFGVLGNAASIFLLSRYNWKMVQIQKRDHCKKYCSRPEMRSSFNQLLAALASFDLLYLFTMLLEGVNILLLFTMLLDGVSSLFLQCWDDFSTMLPDG